MDNHVTVLLGVTLALLVSGTSNASAQHATSFEQLQSLVKTRDRVSITDTTGKVSKGRVVQLSNSSLQLFINGDNRAFSEADVIQITRRQGDSLTNGGTIGALVGAGIWGVGAAACRGECGGAPLSALGILTALGAGAGLGMDALRGRELTIYGGPRTSSMHIRMTPLLSLDRKGVLLSLWF